MVGEVSDADSLNLDNGESPTIQSIAGLAHLFNLGNYFMRAVLAVNRLIKTHGVEVDRSPPGVSVLSCNVLSSFAILLVFVYVLS